MIFYTILFLLILCYATFTDFATRTVPYPITLWMIVVGLFHSFSIYGVVGGLVCGLLGFILFQKDIWGGADFLILTAMGSFFGIQLNTYVQPLWWFFILLPFVTYGYYLLWTKVIIKLFDVDITMPYVPVFLITFLLTLSIF